MGSPATRLIFSQSVSKIQQLCVKEVEEKHMMQSA